MNRSERLRITEKEDHYWKSKRKIFKKLFTNIVRYDIYISYLYYYIRKVYGLYAYK